MTVSSQHGLQDHTVTMDRSVRPCGYNTHVWVITLDRSTLHTYKAGLHDHMVTLDRST